MLLLRMQCGRQFVHTPTSNYSKELFLQNFSCEMHKNLSTKNIYCRVIGHSHKTQINLHIHQYNNVLIIYNDRGWDGWMASLTRWIWVWVNSGSWWWTGRPGALWFMGSQRVGHDWATELNWTELNVPMGFPGGTSGKEPVCQCRRHKRCRFNPWVRKIPWRRLWQPTPGFLPGKSHGQRSLVGYSPRGGKRVKHDWSNLSYVS